MEIQLPNKDSQLFKYSLETIRKTAELAEKALAQDDMAVVFIATSDLQQQCEQLYSTYHAILVLKGGLDATLGNAHAAGTRYGELSEELQTPLFDEVGVKLADGTYINLLEELASYCPVDGCPEHHPTTDGHANGG